MYQEQVMGSSVSYTGKLTVYENLKLSNLLHSEAVCIFFLPSFVFAASGIVFFLFIKSRAKSIAHIHTRSGMARYTLRSIAVASWMVSVVLLAQYISTFSYMDQYIDKDQVLRHYKKFFRAQTISGYATFVSFIVIFLIEIPIIWILVRTMRFKKVCTVHYCIKVVQRILITTGYSGAFLAVQISSVFAFFTTMLLFLNPIYTVIRVTTIMLALCLPVLFLTAIQVLIVSGWQQHCSKEAVIKLVIAFFLGTLMFCINLYILKISYRGIMTDDPFAPNSIATALFTSALLAAFGYVCRKLIAQTVNIEITSSIKQQQEYQPLMDSVQLLTNKSIH